jgi:hypothetical protein
MRFLPFHAKINKADCPDLFENTDTGELQLPELDSDFVISKAISGEVISRFKDNNWDLCVYSIKTTRWSFYSQWGMTEEDAINDPLTSKIIYEMKIIMLLLISDRQFHKSKPIKVSTATKYFNSLRSISLIAKNDGVSLSEFKNNSWTFRKLMDSFKAKGLLDRHSRQTIFISDCMSFIRNTTNLSIPIILSDDQSLIIRRYNIACNDAELKRAKVGGLTPLIPVRIYTNLINDCTEIVNDFLKVSDCLMELLYRRKNEVLFCEEKTKLGGYHSRVKNKYYKVYGKKLSGDELNVTPEQAVFEYGLIDYFEKYPITYNGRYGRVKYYPHLIRSLLNKIRYAARILTFIYSGMRIHENSVMSQDALQNVNIPEIGDIPIIISQTSKLSNSNYSEEELPWATCKEVEPAIKAASIIAKYFIIDNGADDLKNYQKKDLPLWPTSKKVRVSKVPVHYDFHIDHEQYGKVGIDELSNDPDRYKITADDLKELESFDAFSLWREKESFQIGAIWPFASHQCRRSTAIYSARSGMVDIPSLKFQFKHLSEAMTLLYRYDAAFGRNLLDLDKSEKDKYLIISDYMDEVRHIEAMNFINDVRNNPGILSGGAGTRLQQIKDEGYPEWWDNEYEVQKKIGNGEMGYRRTKVGSCSKWSMCEHLGVSEVIPCFKGCPDNIQGTENREGLDKGHKLKLYKKELEIDLDYLDPNHPSATYLKEEIQFIDSKLID